jgi:hypothetical protein
MANASPSSAAHAPSPSSPPASPHASGGGGRDEEEAHGDFERDGDLTAEEMELERKAIFKCVAAACVSPWRAAETTGDGLGFSPCRESSGVQRERFPTETGGADRVHIARVLRARTLHGEPAERGGCSVSCTRITNAYRCYEICSHHDFQRWENNYEKLSAEHRCVPSSLRSG